MPTIDWDSEQWVIDRLVEAVHEDGDTEALGERLMRGQAQDDWYEWKSGKDGVLVPFHLLKEVGEHEPDEVFDLLERTDALSGERWKELEDVAQLTPDEVELWRDLFAENQFDGGDGEVNMWAVREVTHTDGRTVFVAERTFARILDPEPSTFLGAFASLEEGLDAVKTEGYISREDYQARRKAAKRTRR